MAVVDVVDMDPMLDAVACMVDGVVGRKGLLVVG